MDPQIRHALLRGVYIGAAIRRWELQHGSLEGKPLTKRLIEHYAREKFNRENPHPCPNQEKKTMRTLNLACLIPLASTASEPEDDFEFDGALGDAFKEAAVEAEKEAKVAAVSTIKALMQKNDELKTSYRGQLRRLRAEERRVKNALTELDRAKAYAAETSNFIPWGVAMGFTSPSHYGCSFEEFERLSKIPAGWEPKPKEIASE